MLMKYAELGTVHRNQPCQEYPGSWLLCTPKYLEDKGYSSCSYSTQELAQAAGLDLINKLEAAAVEYSPYDICLCWGASDNDPRIGQVWFTGFYKLGNWNVYGQFRHQ
jgi:hypothetical protein